MWVVGSAKAFWIYLLFFPSLFALADDLSQYNGEFRLAKEIELKPIRLQALMRYFTIPGAFRGDLTETMLNAYLDDFDNLQSLPKETREKLVQGLEADLGATFIETQKIVDAQGKPASLAPPSVRIYSQVTDTGQSSTGSIPLSRPAFSSAQLERTRAAQANVRERWTRLTYWDKVRAVDLSRIDPMSMGAFAENRPDEIKIRTDIPVDIRILLRSMNWHSISGGLEIKDRISERMTDPMKFLRNLQRFGEISGMSSYLRDPLKNHDGESSLHIHISTVDESRDLTSLLHAINHLFLLRFIEAGESEAMFSMEGYGFRSNLDARGILRMLTKNHFEIRTHLKTPEQELSEVLRWLSLPEKEALKEIYSEAKEHLENGKIFDSLLQDRRGVVAACSLLALGTEAGVDLSGVAVKLEKETPKVLKSTEFYLKDLASSRGVAETHPKLWRKLYREVMKLVTTKSINSSPFEMIQDLFAIGDAEHFIKHPRLVEELESLIYQSKSVQGISGMLWATFDSRKNAPPNELGRLLRDSLRKRLSKADLPFLLISWGKVEENLQALVELDREDPSHEFPKNLEAGSYSRIVRNTVLTGGTPTQIFDALRGRTSITQDVLVGERWRPFIQALLKEWDPGEGNLDYYPALERLDVAEKDIALARNLKDLGVPSFYTLLVERGVIQATSASTVCRSVPATID